MLALHNLHGTQFSNPTCEVFPQHVYSGGRDEHPGIGSSDRPKENKTVRVYSALGKKMGRDNYRRHTQKIQCAAAFHRQTSLNNIPPTLYVDYKVPKFTLGMLPWEKGRSKATFCGDRRKCMGRSYSRKVSQGLDRRRLHCRAIDDDLQQYGVLRLPSRDVEILTLLVPALGSVFLDPAMQVIDTGKPHSPQDDKKENKILESNIAFLV